MRCQILHCGFNAYMEDSFSLQKFGLGKATSGSLWGKFVLPMASVVILHA
ncbi:TPA: hypothetical protein RQK25_003223 [Vibrio vulnificus]|nr:hypothetical protein [Vibrio vulnificus]